MQRDYTAAAAACGLTLTSPEWLSIRSAGRQGVARAFHEGGPRKAKLKLAKMAAAASAKAIPTSNASDAPDASDASDASAGRTAKKRRRRANARHRAAENRGGRLTDAQLYLIFASQRAHWERLRTWLDSFHSDGGRHRRHPRRKQMLQHGWESEFAHFRAAFADYCGGSDSERSARTRRAQVVDDGGDQRRPPSPASASASSWSSAAASSSSSTPSSSTAPSFTAATSATTTASAATPASTSLPPPPPPPDRAVLTLFIATVSQALLAPPDEQAAEALWRIVARDDPSLLGGTVGGIARVPAAAAPLSSLSSLPHLSPALGEDNVGRRMLEAMGWQAGEGLGREGWTGIVEPVKAAAQPRFQSCGLGFTGKGGGKGGKGVGGKGTLYTVHFDLPQPISHQLVAAHGSCC